uniref:NB-ARC domain-containing protein n=1 Tax=Leersia perrieri TaxID=77586 RepID=A0A0D9XF97_9ORYZ
MEATGLSLAKSALNGVLSYGKSALEDEITLQLGVQREVIFMRNELEMMRSFLMAGGGGGKRQHGVVRTWAKQVRDLAYDVEDCIRVFSLLPRGGWWSSSPHAIRLRHRVAADIRVLKARVEEVSQRNLRYRLIVDIDDDSTTAAPPPAATDHQPGGGFLRRRWRRQQQPPVDLLPLLIIKGDKSLQVLSVCSGTATRGGDLIGNALVIKEALDHPMVPQKFGCQAWVNLTHPFDPTEFLQSMVRQFYVKSLVSNGGNKAQGGSTLGVEAMKKMEATEGRHLGDDFDGYVNDKSYLIVIEGLSTIVQWDWIKTYFPDRGNGSRIIVSTHQMQLAILCTGQPYQVSELSHDQPVYVFFKEGINYRPTSLSNEIEEDHSKHMAEGNSQGKGADDSGAMSTSFFEQVQLVGREREKAGLIQLISSGGDQRQVISVWAMGGMGKTTLVRSIYGSKELSGHFEFQAWLTVPHPFSLRDFFRNLAEQLQYYKSQGKSERNVEFGVSATNIHRLANMKVEDVILESAELLKGNKYLIVIDDLSSIREWESIIPEFHDEKNGSCIIITTRVASVAKHCSVEDQNVYNLESLKDDASHDLFYKKVFKETENIDRRPAIIEQANLILKKCNGLPLAITAIGGFLATRPKIVMEWQKLNDHITAELEINPSLEMIRTVLTSSYDGLPHHLKSCFLYLSIYPAAYSIRRRRLIRCWIAEGYSKELRGMTAEEIGESYLADLMNRSMIQPSKTVVGVSGIVRLCKVHDLMREIIIPKAMEESLVFALDEYSCLNSQAQDTVRHLTISSTWERDASVFATMLELSHLRSLTVFGEWRSFLISDKMRLLQVLDLEDAVGVKDHDIKQVGKLILLKYLSLRGCSDVFHLPGSLGNLRHLETLDIRDTSIVKLPMTTMKLQRLQYLRAGKKPAYGYNPMASTEKLGMSCRDFLASIYQNIGWSSSSNRFASGPYFVEVPKHIGKLKALNTLGIVHVSKEKGILKELKQLTQLRKLGVAGVNMENCKEFCSVVACHERLLSLSVLSEGMQGLSSCLAHMSLPPINLQSLKLYGNLSKLPEWVGLLQNLAKLKLCGTMLKQDAIELLAMLPNLTILRLLRGSFWGEEICFGKTYSSLAMLELAWLPELQSVNIRRESLPKLELLHINYCRLLKGGDKISGLEFLPTLKEMLFDVTDEPAVVRNRNIREAKEDEEEYSRAKEEICRRIRAHAQVTRAALQFKQSGAASTPR